MDGQPLVRFVVDDALKHGKFEIIAEMVAAPIIAQLRAEEMQRYGLVAPDRPAGPAAQRFAARGGNGGYGAAPQQRQQVPPQPAYYDDGMQDQGAYGREGAREPLPYVPQDELDYSIDYGEYTFNSLDYNDYQGNSDAQSAPFPQGVPGVPNVGVNAPARGAGRPASAIGTVSHRDPVAPATEQLDAAAERVACLVDMASSRTYELAGTHMTIGRESGNDIQIADINASRRHAELTLDASGVWVLADLGSTNGTMVNNRTIAVQPLALGDRITVGTTILMYTLA